MSRPSIADGPRGRRLCLELARALDERISRETLGLAFELDPGRSTSRVVLAMAGTGPEKPEPQPTASVPALVTLLGEIDAAAADGATVQEALSYSVDSARYWQEPDGEDVLAALPQIRAALAPIAAALDDRTDLAWWHVDRRERQWAIDWRDPADAAPLAGDPATELARWADAARAEEARSERERPSDPASNITGIWWSAPTTLLSTTGELPDGRPAGLLLVEDALGWETATAIPIRGAGRTYEIRGPEDWAELCRRHPLEVTASRRHDWYRTTGRAGRWVMPDWQSVATEWDAVHLTTVGYLSAATRDIPIDDEASSVIAGWAPDATYWLSDVAREADGQRTFSRRTPGDEWVRAD